MSRTIAFFLLATAAVAADLPLVENGKSAYSILVPLKAQAPERFAAEELRRYIRLIAGVELPAGAQVKPPFISIGATAVAAGLTPKPRWKEDDSYRIEARSGNLILAGTNPRGTLYAVYDLLETFGCRWFAPDFAFYRHFHETVPARSSLSVPAGLRRLVQPAFKLRGEYPEHYYTNTPDDLLALLDWCGKNRVNLVGFRQNEFGDAWYALLEPAARKRGLLIGTAGHGYDRFLPRDRYFRSHPEWYAEEGGVRTDRYFNQFCTSNAHAMAEFERNLRDFARRYRGLYHISAMPNDSPRWCQCASCQREKISSKDRWFKMTQLISRIVYEENPRLKVEVGVGIEYFGVSASELVTSKYPNLTYRSGVLRRCLRHAWDDPACEVNRPQYEAAAAITRRIVAMGSDVIWTSRYGSFREQSLPGILYPEQMRAEFAGLRKLGASGVLYNYSTIQDWLPYELKQRLYTRLLVDPETPVPGFLERYYQERFPGSPAEAGAFYTSLRAAMERYDHPGGGYTRENQYGLYPDGQFDAGFRDMAEAQRHIDAAMKKNSNRDERQLLWLLNASLQYAKGKLELDRLAQNGQAGEGGVKAASLMDYIEKWDNRGIFYDSVFLRRSVEYRFAGPPRDELIKKRPWGWVRMYEFEDFSGEPAAPRQRPQRPPRQPQASTSRAPLMAVLAHPDDETTLGPLLAKYAHEGHPVYVVMATSGQKGVTANTSLPAGDRLGAAREAELKAAAAKLGTREPTFLGYQDQGISSPAVMEEIAGKLRKLIGDLKPEVLITWGPDGLTGHVDHRAISNIATQVFQQQAALAHKPRKLYYLAWPESLFVNAPPPFDRPGFIRTVADVLVTTAVDCAAHTPAAYEAIQCHKTQWDATRMKQNDDLNVKVLGGKVYLRLAAPASPRRPQLERELF